MRRGSRPKVTSPVRWLHSDVTARMPTTGRMSAIGIVVAWRYSPNACWPPSLKNMIVSAIAMMAPMPMSSQRPARVSSILRSSTWTRRPNGTPVVGRGPAMRLGTLASVGSADSAFLETGAPPGTLGRGRGGHAATSSRAASAVRSRNISSSPRLSAPRSSVRTIWWASGDAADGDRLGLDLQAAGGGALRDDRGLGERGHEGVVVGGARERAGPGEQLVLGALGDDLAVADDDDLVGDALDLVEQVRAEQHGAALVGVAAQQVAHPADAGRVETVGRLVEDEHLGVAEQRVGDAEPLAHAEGVVAHPAVRLLLGEADELDHLVDAVPPDAHEDRAERQHLAAGAAGVLGGRVEQQADVAARVRQGGIRLAEHGGPARGRRGEAGHDAHRGRLAGTVRPEEAGDEAGLDLERDVVDGRERAVALGESFHCDHGLHPPGRRRSRIRHKPDSDPYLGRRRP